MNHAYMNVLTSHGCINIDRMKIISIDPSPEGARIEVVPQANEQYQIVNSIEPYDRILELYFTT